MTIHLLRTLLAESGYAVSFRRDEWTECFVSNGAEHWRGLGLDEEDALADLVRQMFPSSLARMILAQHPRQGTPPPQADSNGAGTGVVAAAEPASIERPASTGDSAKPSPSPASPESRTAGPVRTGGIVTAAKTCRGRVRVRNEDACLALPESGLVAVADGLGGRPAGNVASTMAIDTLRRVFEGAPALSPVHRRGQPMLVAALQRASADIFDAGRKEPTQRGMGTTIAAALCVGRSVVLAHVGDSRIYRLRRGVLGLLTTDHSVRNERIRSGKPAAAGANVVTRALGVQRTVDVETSVVSSQPGDVLVLCTDGLHGVVENEELARAVGQLLDPEVAVDQLLALANAHGGPDNVTVAVVQWGTPPPAPPL